MSQLSTATASHARSDRDQFERLDWLLLVGLSVVWGASFLLMAVGLESLHPGMITWLRVASGALTLVVLRRETPALSRAHDRTIWLLALTWVAIPFTLFPIAEQHVNSAVAGILNGATPIWAALIGGLWFGRPSRGAQRIGLVIGFVGMVLVSVSSSSAGGATAGFGVAMVLVATVMYGISLNMLGPLQQRHGSVAVMRLLLLRAVLLVTPFGLFGLARSSFSWVPVLAILALGIVGTGIAFVMMGTLAGRVGGPRASFVTYLVPVVAVVLGVAILDDHVTPLALVGVVLVIAGAVAASRREA